MCYLRGHRHRHHWTGLPAEPAPPKKSAATAVIYQNQLIGLAENGRIYAWSLDDGRLDEDMSAKLTGKFIRHLASDGDQLWATDKSTLDLWVFERKTLMEEGWPIQSRRSSDRIALIGSEGTPLLIFPTRVKTI